jgi:hypothetical protein
LQRAPSPSGLVDVVDLILDKGLVIDAYVRVSGIGIEVLTVDARIVVASVDTYLRFAEAVNRLDLRETEIAGLPELQERTSEKISKHRIEETAAEPKRALKKTGEKPSRAVQRGEKKAKEMFDELKERVGGDGKKRKAASNR